MRAPDRAIHAPPFPPRLPWVNVASLRMDRQLGHPVLIEFWDFCRVNSLRTLPYVKGWHERYGPDGLRVIGVHSPGFDPSRDEQAVRAAVARLEIAHPVLIDAGFALWREYENPGWPARYLYDRTGVLVHYHFGEGSYEETELAIQELLESPREPIAALRPQDVPGALLVAPTGERRGIWSGRYAAGAVWTVLNGRGTLRVNGAPRTIDYTGAHLLVDHEIHTVARLELEVGDGLRCHAVCFEAGLGPELPSSS